MISEQIKILTENETIRKKEQEDSRRKKIKDFANYVKKEFKYVQYPPTNTIYTKGFFSGGFHIDDPLLEKEFEGTNIHFVRDGKDYIFYMSQDPELEKQKLSKKVCNSTLKYGIAWYLLFATTFMGIFDILLNGLSGHLALYVIVSFIFSTFLYKYEKSTPKSYIRKHIRKNGLDDLSTKYCLDFLEDKLLSLIQYNSYPPVLHIGTMTALIEFGRWDNAFRQQLKALFESQGLYVLNADDIGTAVYMGKLTKSLFISSSLDEKSDYDCIEKYPRLIRKEGYTYLFLYASILILMFLCLMSLININIYGILITASLLILNLFSGNVYINRLEKQLERLNN